MSGASPLEETYEDVKSLGYSLARIYSGPTLSEDEILAVFDDTFLTAYQGGWQPDKRASFSTWLRTKTYFRILDARKRADTKPRRLIATNLECPEAHADPTSLDPETPSIYERCAKGDARRILEHIAANREHYEAIYFNKDSARKARQEIRAYLGKTFGWNKTRIQAAFNELRTQLKGPVKVKVNLSRSPFLSAALEYIKANPGCSKRDVILGTAGGRTLTNRTYSYRNSRLSALLEAGLVENRKTAPVYHLYEA